jgi:hypothetical protein
MIHRAFTHIAELHSRDVVERGLRAYRVHAMHGVTAALCSAARGWTNEIHGIAPLTFDHG